MLGGQVSSELLHRPLAYLRRSREETGVRACFRLDETEAVLWPTHRFGIVIWSRFLNSNIGEVHVWEEALSRNLGKVGIWASGWCLFMQEDTFVIDGAEGVTCVWEAGKALSVQPGLQWNKLKDKMQTTHYRKCKKYALYGKPRSSVFQYVRMWPAHKPSGQTFCLWGEKQAWKRSLVDFWNLYKSCISVLSTTIDQIGVLYVPLSHKVFHLSCILLLIRAGDVLFNEWTKCSCLEATKYPKTIWNLFTFLKSMISFSFLKRNMPFPWDFPA